MWGNAIYLYVASKKGERITNAIDRGRKAKRYILGMLTSSCQLRIP